MLKIFTRQIQRLGKDEGGQSIVFVALVLIVLVCFLGVTINVGSQVSRKIRLQNAADAAALSGATWEARGLNLIAALNNGISAIIMGMIAYIVFIGVLWFIPGFQGMAAKLTCKAPEWLNRFYNIACRFASLEKQVANFFPVIAEFEVLRIGNANGVRILALPFPFIPVSYKDVHKGKVEMNLGYHVAEGDVSGLMGEVAEEIWRLLNDITVNALENANKLTKLFGLDLKKIVKSTAETIGKAFDFACEGIIVKPEKTIPFKCVETADEEAYKKCVSDTYSAFEDLMAKEGIYKNVTEIKSKKWDYYVEIFKPSPFCKSGCPTDSKKGVCRIKRPPTYSGFPGTGSFCDSALTYTRTPIVKDFTKGKPILGKTYEKDDDCRYSYKDEGNNWVEGSCNYLKEQWKFHRLEVTVVEEYEIGEVDKSKGLKPKDCKLTPLKLDSDFFERQWLAVAAWDTMESSEPTILPKLLSNTNVWGSFAFAQAKPTTKNNKADDVIFHKDWEARLTPFTAIDGIAEGIAGERGGGQLANTIKNIEKNIILH